MDDPDEQRAAERSLWEAAAPGWSGAAAAEMAKAMLPVAHWMVDAIAPQPGQTVLELAGGAGEVGLLAAELLAPGGRLIETDGAEAMVAAAQAKAAERGVGGIEFRTMELEWLDAATASVDAVLCRFGYMLCLDPEAALRETRRVLRQGGRLALAVWDEPEANPWMAVPAAETARALGQPGGLGADPPGPAGYTPGPFGLSRPGVLQELLLDAGFEDVVVAPIPLTFAGPSLDVLWDRLLEVSPSRKDRLAQLAPAEVYAVRDAVDAAWAAHARADGTVALPGRALGARASA